jgi:hypothetical protein
MTINVGGDAVHVKHTMRFTADSRQGRQDAKSAKNRQLAAVSFSLAFLAPWRSWRDVFDPVV